MCDEMESPDLSNAILYADSSRGVYIPQYFAKSIKRRCVSGVDSWQWEQLMNDPSNSSYWEVWNEVEGNAIVTDPDTSTRYRILLDGDLWLVPISD